MRINGWILFASIMMIVVGTMGALNGLIALINDEIYVVTADSIIAFDFTTWGWIHLILGIVVVLAGFALVSGAVWARIVRRSSPACLSSAKWARLKPTRFGPSP